MSNLLSRATEGYLCSGGKRSLLSIATDGYLGCSGYVPPVIPEQPIKVITGTGGWGGNYQDVKHTIDKGKKLRLSLKDPESIKDQNNVLMAIIKTYIKCKQENIL